MSIRISFEKQTWTDLEERRKGIALVILKDEENYSSLQMELQEMKLKQDAIDSRIQENVHLLENASLQDKKSLEMCLELKKELHSLQKEYETLIKSCSTLVCLYLLCKMIF